MKRDFIKSVLCELSKVIDSRQLENVESVLTTQLQNFNIVARVECEEQVVKENNALMAAFLSAKKIEGCSAKTIKYYQSTIEHLFVEINKMVSYITTNDIRTYLAQYQEHKGSSKVTIDNIRRIFSSFFAWLEDEDYIVKSPVRRIHKVRTDTLVKEVINDECMELLRDSCTEIRDLAIIDLLASTGIRVGELVQMNIEDIDFQERQCKVFGKGNKEREVYFNARAKIHLQQYVAQRRDDNPALFVSLSSPHKRLSISGVEVRLRTLGKRLNLSKIHPHKFRRTLATMAIDKGMPIEQVQRLLGHVKIDTTLHYAMVNQHNVKISHRRYIG
ncbi:MAG: site-specific tyrosine recombinase/integron integrase [Alistipes sp.]